MSSTPRSSVSSSEADEEEGRMPLKRIGLFGSFIQSQPNSKQATPPQSKAPIIDVYIAAASFFFAGVIDDAIDLTHKQVRPWTAVTILLGHTIGVHIICAIACTYVHHFPNLKQIHQNRLRAPLAILTGWMWKSVVEDASELLVNASTDNEAAQVLLWFIYAIIVTIIAVIVAVTTSSFGPNADDFWFINIFKYILALTSSSLVLPIAGVWNEALTAFVDAAVPDTVSKATTTAVLYALKALFLHACFATTTQCILNFRRRSHVTPLPPPIEKNNNTVIARRNATAWAKYNFVLRRRIFENKVLLYVTAWGWWDVPQAIIFSPEFNNRPIYRLLAICVIVLLVMNSALLKTWFAVPLPEVLSNYFYIFFALSCHALDPQLGWAIKELYTQSILDFSNSYSAQVALFWSGVWMCCIIYFLLIKYLACIDGHTAPTDNNDEQTDKPPLVEGYAQTDAEISTEKKNVRSQQDAKQAELWSDDESDNDVSVWTDEFTDIDSAPPRRSNSKKLSRKNSSKRKSKKRNSSRHPPEPPMNDNNPPPPGGPSYFCSNALPW
mmetsp:Transcript_13812/g.20660  ORF Transcript_13812/g.20660 Transcript_13812/m.20660 type:complete len:553 (-) Transcript_13812:770-2428(-)|eukprot:CAMPEP_0197320336 /NCGR_PEP_ID=MMETSP0891-20130614/59116_1 /TAXON_ID=44058 ORGANISM="Aureoumbra lagunensis, Strain CCMP1510" /NCGR_SAMPLE_ID=MMETSP0891 /ASSEMBLY_ACC=CAM_ASM_000534 /LENGTH=552 /DNA_ID=CAMNT_0042811665 /DNA_START=18 /DNA_END=1676 /DNA_ORIENTATION=-